MEVAITIDLEHDCPPFLTTYRGVTQGMPLLLELLAAEGVPATFFCTGDVARKHPEIVRRLVDEGHELGCHGDTHARFGGMDRATAERELRDGGATLRAFGCEVTSFRAPNLDFPAEFRAAAGRQRFPARLFARAPQAGLVLRVSRRSFASAPTASSACRRPSRRRRCGCRGRSATRSFRACAIPSSSSSTRGSSST